MTQVIRLLCFNVSQSLLIRETYQPSCNYISILYLTLLVKVVKAFYKIHNIL